MLSKIETASSGGADYLEFGIRSDSKLTRKDKDCVIPLYGNLEHIRQAEKYCCENKDWKANYETVVISFSKEDMNRLSNLNEKEYKETLQNITMDYLKHRTSGYELNEVIAYAECHQPKIRINEKGEERLTHIHLQISYINAMNDTKIRTTFYNNSFMSDVVDKYVAKKNGLTYIQTINKDRKKPEKIQEKIDSNKTISQRDKLIKDLKNIENKKQFEEYCKKNELEIEIIKTKKNHYIKLINKDNSTINLRQYEFNDIKKFYGIKPSEQKQSMINDINSKSKEELGEILGSYYKDRIKMIDSRRSKSHRVILEKMIDEDLKYDKNFNKNQEIKSIKNLSFQEKIFYKTYQKDIKDFDFKGYYIDSKNQKTTFKNLQKNIHIEDTGNLITSNSKADSLEEEVDLMLKVAEAKGWNIANLDVTGSDKFKAEVEKQIANRLKEIQKSKNKEVPKIPDYQKERPNSELQNYKKDFVEKQYQKEANTNQDLQKIKTDLNAKVVLDYAVEKYKLNPKDFNITDDNKLDNLGNKAKPKNIIDFLQKEANLSTKEAIEICQDLYKNTHKKEVEKVQEVQKVEEEVKKNKGSRER